MGYSTLYGDTAGAFAPIGGLYKTDVFAVARWRNRQAEIAGEVPPIPEHVFVKPPSAELSPDQEDEKSMGIDYPTLDRLLKAHVDRGLDAAALVSEGFDAADVERVLDDFIFLQYGTMVMHAPTEQMRAQFGMSLDDYFRGAFRC